MPSQVMAVQTNQTADPQMPQLPELACTHAPGEASAQTCAFLRGIERVRAWADRAEHAHRSRRARPERAERAPLDGELWLLFAEVQGAYDRCPDHVALAQVRRESH